MGNPIREALESAAESLDTGGESDGGTAEPVGVVEPVASEPAGHTSDAGAAGATAEGDSEGGGETPAQAKARDEKGRFAEKKAEDVKVAKAKTAIAIKPAAGVGPGTAKPGAPILDRPDPAADVAAPAPEALKAPASWKPAAREKWAAMPAEVQQEVTRRERETATVLQEAANSKRFAQEFQAAVAPFEGMMRAAGNTPMQAIGAMMQTGAALRSGIPSHRAQVVAQIIKQYDVPIDVLDQVLAGQAPAQSQGSQGGGYQDPRVDQLMSHLQQAAQQRSQVSTQKMQGEISNFATSHEFYEDVREDMADMLEVAGRRGVALSLEDAYNRAVKLHPDVSAVFEQRKAAEAAKASQASTQRARAASTSVKPQPAGVTAPQPKGIRAQLADAAAKLHGG